MSDIKKLEQARGVQNTPWKSGSALVFGALKKQILGSVVRCPAQGCWAANGLKEMNKHFRLSGSKILFFFFVTAGIRTRNHLMLRSTIRTTIENVHIVHIMHI